MVCHNEIRGGVSNFARKAFTPTHVRDNPKINTVCAVQGGGGYKRVPFGAQGGSEGGGTKSNASGCRGQTIFTTCLS